jgi:hypothetical protein
MEKQKVDEGIGMSETLAAYKHNYIAAIKDSLDLLKGLSEVDVSSTQNGVFTHRYINDIPDGFKKISHASIFIIMVLNHYLHKLPSSPYGRCNFCRKPIMPEIRDTLQWLYIFKKFEIRIIYFDKSMDIFDSILAKFDKHLSNEQIEYYQVNNEWLLLYSSSVQCPFCQSRMVEYPWNIVTNVSLKISSYPMPYLKHVAELMSIYRYLTIEYNKIENN